MIAGKRVKAQNQEPKPLNTSAGIKLKAAANHRLPMDRETGSLSP
jgi:hypothetical protein